MRASQPHEREDGAALLKLFVEELRHALDGLFQRIEEFEYQRLNLLLDELSVRNEPKQIAQFLVRLGHELNAHAVDADIIVSIYQFALQCHPTCLPALRSAIQKFSELNRWSMVLKLLNMKSALGSNRSRRLTHYEMSHIYRGFYRSAEGEQRVLERVRYLPHSEVEPVSELWFALVTLGSDAFYWESYHRVVEWLQGVGDSEFARVFGCRGVDHLMLTDVLKPAVLPQYISLVDGTRSTLLRLSGLLLQRRGPTGLPVETLNLTSRERFSLDALNALLYHSGGFDEEPQPADGRSWVLGWLLGRERFEGIELDRALQWSHGDDELSTLLNVSVISTQVEKGHLTPIQTARLMDRPSLVGWMRVMHTLWVNGRLEQLSSFVADFWDARFGISLREEFIEFRQAEIAEARGDFEVATKIFSRLFASLQNDWALWSACARTQLKRFGKIEMAHLEVAPILGITQGMRGVVERWLSLEKGAFAGGDEDGLKTEISAIISDFGLQGLLAEASVNHLREHLLRPTLSAQQVRLLPSEPSGQSPLSIHEFVTFEWLVGGYRIEQESLLRGLIGRLPDTAEAYSLALRSLVICQHEHEQIDEMLAAKLPQQHSTMRAVSQRVIRRRRLAVGADEMGELGLLIGRRTSPQVGHELVALRAWTVVVRTGEWSDSVEIWGRLLDSAMGCFSAELGLVCGFPKIFKSWEDKRDNIRRLYGQLTNFDLKSVVLSWAAVLRIGLEQGSSELGASMERIEDALNACVIGYGSRGAAALARCFGFFERFGWSAALSAVMKTHLAKAYELEGDVLSALRTHLEIAPRYRTSISIQWLSDWLSRDGNVELAESLVGKFSEVEAAEEFEFSLAQLYRKSGFSVKSIQTYTHLLGTESFRFFALNDLGSWMSSHERYTEGAQFYLELAKMTRSQIQRRRLLQTTLGWLENGTVTERLGEVYQLLYHEYEHDFSYVQRASQYFLKVGQPELLAECLKEIAQLSGAGSHEVSLELLKLYIHELNRPHEAKELCLELVAQHSSFGDGAIINLGDSAAELSMWAHMAELYETLLERSFDDIERLERYGHRLASIYHEKLANYTAAREVMETVRRLSPNSADALERVAYLSLSDGSPNDQIRRDIEHAIAVLEKGERRAALLVKLAEIMEKEGDGEHALRIRHAALSDSPGNLMLVGTVVDELLALGREQEASATLLRFELLNEGREVDVIELHRLRNRLGDESVQRRLPENASIADEGGALIVKQLLNQLATDGGDVTGLEDWVSHFTGAGIDEFSFGRKLGLCLRQRARIDFNVDLKRGLLDLIEWLDDRFAVCPNSDEVLPDRPLESQTRFCGAIRQIRWAALPLHTAFDRGDTLILSRKIRDLPPWEGRVLIQYFVELASLGGLAFTRWSRNELVVMTEEYFRCREGAPKPSDKDRNQIRDLLEKHLGEDLKLSLPVALGQSIHLLTGLIEEVIGRALELALLGSHCVDATFRALTRLDDSLVRYHRGGEILLSELLPRTLLRHYGELSEGFCEPGGQS